MYQKIRAKLQKRQPILLDAGIGSELVRRGIRWRKHGLLTDAPAVQQLAEEYAAAGADVLRTNTLQLNPRIYLNVFRNREHMKHIGAPGLAELVPHLLRRSVQLARAACANAGREGQAAIAGVLSPLEHCFRPDLAPLANEGLLEHQALVRVFAEEKVDLLLLESMNTIGEAKAALAAGRAAGLPVWVSFVLGPEGDLLGREPLRDAVEEMAKDGAEAVLVNCVPPGDVTRAMEKLGTFCSLPYGGFAHVGRFSPPSWKFDFFPQFVDTEEWPAERYAAEARQWREAGATILGGCCGTNPKHTAALRALWPADGKEAA